MSRLVTVYLYTDSDSEGEETLELEFCDADGADIADAVAADVT